MRDEEFQIKAQLNDVASELEPITVRIEDIQALIERQTGIPVQKLQKAEQKKNERFKHPISC